MQLRRTLATSTRDLGNRPRLLLVAKAAAAAALAWYLVPLVPFAADKYSYYAPLGVVISMYPTLARSARSGLQTLIGLALGIGIGVGIGLGTLALGGSSVIAVGLVVAVGMLLSGVHALGAGRDWITIPALFVLLLGETNAEAFSVSYLINVAFGIAIGVAVNLLVFPPLYLRRAGERVTSLRDLVAARLHEMAERFANGEHDDDLLESAMNELLETSTAVRNEVTEANESKKGNPRGRRQPGQDQDNFDRLRALERAVFFTRDLADVVSAMERDQSNGAIGDRTRRDLSTAMDSVADLISAPPKAEGSPGYLSAADGAIKALMDSVDDQAASRPSANANHLTAAVCLRRIVDASRPFVR